MSALACVYIFLLCGTETHRPQNQNTYSMIFYEPYMLTAETYIFLTRAYANMHKRICKYIESVQARWTFFIS